MDIRTPLSIKDRFLEILINCKERKLNAAMLLDVKGNIKAEGLIRAIYWDAPKPYLELESGTKVILKTIKAVNGIFSPSLSEC